MELRKFLAVVFVLGTIGSGSASAACSSATLKGNYGFTVSGLNSSFTLTATVGQIVADGSGGITGSETVSDDGIISSNAITGSYSIKSDCSGTIAITQSGGSTSNYNLNIAPKGRIELVETDSGFTEYGYALAQGNATCTLAGIKGKFSFRGGGFNSSLAPSAFAGQGTNDGNGNLTGTETGSAAGQVFSLAISGTYTMNSNCTGSVTFSAVGINPVHANFVVVSGGQSALQINTDAGNIVTSVADRQ